MRPWSRKSLGTQPELVLSTHSDTDTFTYTTPDDAAWAYLCALLEDTSTTQRLEYCLDEWNSWGAAPDQVTTIFTDLDTSPTQAFTNVVTNFGPRTTFATTLGRSSRTGVGAGPLGRSANFKAAITKANLASAVFAINAGMRAANGAVCPSGPWRCYSSRAGDYQLLGLENGREFRVGAAGTATVGGDDSRLSAVTVYRACHAHRCHARPSDSSVALVSDGGAVSPDLATP
jgi:hypothetical protein